MPTPAVHATLIGPSAACHPCLFKENYSSFRSCVTVLLGQTAVLNWTVVRRRMEERHLPSEDMHDHDTVTVRPSRAPTPALVPLSHSTPPLQRNHIFFGDFPSFDDGSSRSRCFATSFDGAKEEEGSVTEPTTTNPGSNLLFVTHARAHTPGKGCMGKKAGKEGRKEGRNDHHPAIKLLCHWHTTRHIHALHLPPSVVTLPTRASHFRSAVLL